MSNKIKFLNFFKFFIGLIAIPIFNIVLIKILNKYSNNPLVIFLVKIWNLPIYTANKITVSFGKIFIAIFLILFGLFFAKSISEKIIKKILNHSNLESGLKASIENILYYFLVVIFSIVALNIAEVPLTILTVLGGALAIGIGFGSQNIMNNFISGLILQMERPIKVGDIVEIENITGKILEIGARSTKIISAHNHISIIPNNFFLDKKFVNWTYNDNKIRFNIQFGVANNIDFNEIKRHIDVVLTDLSISNNDYKFFIHDFNENMIIYGIYIWHPIREILEKPLFEASIREKIVSKLYEEKILISLPKDKKDFLI